MQFGTNKALKFSTCLLNLNSFYHIEPNVLCAVILLPLSLCACCNYCNALSSVFGDYRMCAELRVLFNSTCIKNST